MQLKKILTMIFMQVYWKISRIYFMDGAGSVNKTYLWKKEEELELQGEELERVLATPLRNFAAKQMWDCFHKRKVQPWLAWLSRLSFSKWKVTGLIPGRAHAWVVGQVPVWGCAGGNQSKLFSLINISLPLFLPPFPSP